MIIHNSIIILLTSTGTFAIDKVDIISCLFIDDFQIQPKRVYDNKMYQNILDKKTVDDDSIKGIELSVSVHSFGYQILRISKVAE